MSDYGKRAVVPKAQSNSQQIHKKKKKKARSTSQVFKCYHVTHRGPAWCHYVFPRAMLCLVPLLCCSVLGDLVLWALWGPSCWEFSTAAPRNLLQKEDLKVVARAEFPSSSPEGKNGNCLRSRFSWCLSCNKSLRRVVLVMSMVEMESQPQSPLCCWVASFRGWMAELYSSFAVLLPPVWNQHLMAMWNNTFLFVGVFAFCDECLLVKVGKPLRVPCLPWIWQSISSCKTLKLLLQDALLFGSDLAKYLWNISVYGWEYSGFPLNYT